jgi:hypothetical protein
MSVSLVVLLPLILLGIVAMLCFVGCGLHTHGLLEPFTTYTGTTILLNPACIAYWPLRDAADTVPAAELISDNKGNYIDPNTAPPMLYPWPPFTLPNPPGPDVQSAGAPGAILFTQPGIVKGDAVQPDDPNILMPCVVVNGCYVEIPFNMKFIPPTSFTVEAWVRADWSASDPHAWRFVLDMRDFNPGRGFALFAKAEDNQPGVYRWAGAVGNGGAGGAAFTTVATDELTIPLSSAGTPVDPTYLALTYDSASQTLTLFVNGEQQGQVTSIPYMPNSIQPLWIGAGAPFVPRRPQAADVPGSPLFPFVGAIQDVAIYNKALIPTDILTHFQNGSGNESENESDP